MSREFELIGMAAAGGWLKWRRERADLEPGTPCQNCQTPLEGPYCHSCGQLAEDMHKSVWKLFGEVLESFFHYDGRLFRTLPNLVIRPGRLTRSYLDGRRTSQVPPFRLFLVALLVAFLAGQCSSRNAPELAGERPANSVRVGSLEEGRKAIMADESLTEEERAEALNLLNSGWMRGLESIGGEVTVTDDEAARTPAAEKGVVPESMTLKPGQKVRVMGREDDAATQWFTERIRAINENPERFFMILETWAHRVAVLALPVSALILSLLFVFQRRFFVFDHLVFSMHSLSFQLLLLTAILFLSMAMGGWAWWLVVLAPVHLFVHMRGTYGTHWALTLLRMFVLFIFTVIAFSILALLWLYLGINEMGG